MFFVFCKQKTAYEMRISDWSSDVCSSDLAVPQHSERSAQTRLAHCDMRYEKAAIMFGQAFAERCILCNEKGVMPAPGGFQVKQFSDMPAAGTGEENLRPRAILFLFFPQPAPSGFPLL